MTDNELELKLKAARYYHDQGYTRIEQDNACNSVVDFKKIIEELTSITESTDDFMIAFTAVINKTGKDLADLTLGELLKLLNAYRFYYNN